MSERPSRLELAPPPDVVLNARAVMGAIDLDPYTTAINNQLVLAARTFCRDLMSLEEILSQSWATKNPTRLFLGPPVGGAATRRLINKALREYRAGNVQEAIFWLGHNETLIRAPWLWDFPCCIPFRRLRSSYYDDELEQFRTLSPSDWSVVFYLPPAVPASQFHTKLSRFHVTFSDMGRVVFNSFSGEDDWQASYKRTLKKSYDYRE